jgi:hypothetical protein
VQSGKPFSQRRAGQDVLRALDKSDRRETQLAKILVKILLDYDVLLDIVAAREKFLADSARALDACKTDKIQGNCLAHTGQRLLSGRG